MDTAWKYDSTRSNYDGVFFTVGFSRNDGIVSSVIRWITRSKVSHCWFSFKMANTPLLFHADFLGVCIGSKAAFALENTVVAEFEMRIDFAPVIDEMLRDLGAAYDYAGIVGHLWVLLGRVFGRQWENPLQRKDRWYCSEMVSYFLKECGEDVKLPPASISPDCLMRFLETSNRACKID